MAKVIPPIVTPTWAAVPYIETTDRVLGGLTGVSNASALALYERSEFLKNELAVVNAALAQAVVTLESDISNQAATTAQNYYTKVDADGTLAQAILDLQAYSDDAAGVVQAGLTDVLTARIGYSTRDGVLFDADGTITNKTEMDAWNAANVGSDAVWNVGLPLSSAIKKLQVTVDGGTASLEDTMTAMKTATGTLEARHTLKLDVNGYISGTESVNDGITSVFTILADKFMVVKPDGSGAPIPLFVLQTVGLDTILTLNGDLYAENGTFSGTLVGASGSFGSIEIDAGGHIRLGQTAFNTGNGFWIGDNGGVPMLSIGDPAGSYLSWDGINLNINQPTFEAFSASVPLGDIVLTGLPISEQPYGSRTVVASGGKAPYSYFWMIAASTSTGYMSHISAGQGTATASFRGTGDGTTTVATVACFVTDSNGRTTTVTFGISAQHNSAA